MKFKLTFLDRFKDTALLIARFVVGAFFIFVHGYPKLGGGPERWEKLGSALSTLGIHDFHMDFGFLAGLFEFIGGILIVLGLWFRPASLAIFMVLLVASARNLLTDGWFAAAHPIEVMMLMLVFAFVGPGRYSVDKDRS
jgi:putative oxidoreductase